MKGMKKFFSFLVAMIFCFCLVGCWDGDGGGGSKSEPAANEEDGTGTVIFTLAFPDSNFVADANFVDPNATGDVVLQWREFDPRNLPEYRELPEPSADEPSAVIGVDNAQTREKSSNEFYDFLRNDFINNRDTGEVRLDFYGKDPLLDIYGDYLGSRTVKAYDFFAGTAQEKVKAREYYIHAMTYCEFSGYCFQADAHVIFLPNESNRVLFSFRPTGNVLIPCYIPNPAGKYWGNRYDQYHATLKANSAYIWNGPYYNERGELEFTISYAYGNPSDICDEEMELSITATDGLHIMKFSFNLMDITRRQRPLQLVAEEVPTGTIQYSGEFEDEKREIIIDSPADGDVINGFPLIIRGITIGIQKVALQVKNITRGTTPYENFVDIPKDGGFYFSVETFEGVNTGDELKIIITDWRYFQEIPTPENVEIVSVDVVVGHVYKSFPIISQIPLTNEELRIVNGVPQAIYKWKVEASSCGNIGIKQMPKIKVEWQDLGTQSELRLSSLRLFRGTTEITDFVEITNQDGVSVKMSALTEADKAIFIYFLPEEIIAGGATLFYTLKATPENFDAALSGSDKVALIMLADNASAGNKRYVYCDNGIWKLAEDNAGTGAEQFNFLWSDHSALPHSAISGMSTADWFNGYLIKNLPLSHVIMAT